MDLEEALTYELEQIEEFDGKVFPVNAQPFGDSNTVIRAPYVIYTSPYGLHHRTLDGYESGKVIPLEINLVANSPIELKTLTHKLMVKVLSFPLRTIGRKGLFISDLSYEQPKEFYESEAKLYRMLLDLDITI